MEQNHSESRDQQQQALRDFFAGTSETIDPAALQNLNLSQIRQAVPAYANRIIRKQPESVWRESKPVWSTMIVVTFRWRNTKDEFWTIEVDGTNDQAPPGSPASKETSFQIIRFTIGDDGDQITEQVRGDTGKWIPYDLVNFHGKEHL